MTPGRSGGKVRWPRRSPTTTRDELRAEIEDTRTAFHQLLAEIPDAVLGTPSDNPVWTIGEVLFHMSVAPRLMVADVAIITRRPQLTRTLTRLIPQRGFDLWNRVYTRERGRRMDRRRLTDEYDRATDRILDTLAGLRESDLDRTATYPGWDPLLSGEVSLARLFHYVRAHFEAHERQIRDRIPPPA